MALLWLALVLKTVPTKKKPKNQFTNRREVRNGFFDRRFLEKGPPGMHYLEPFSKATKTMMINSVEIETDWNRDQSDEGNSDNPNGKK